MILDLGTIDYREAYKIQIELVRRRKLGAIKDSIIIAEHAPVFTIGRRGTKGNLLVSDELLSRSGIAVLNVDRGGDITFHGPGQLVAYPILDLRRRMKDLHRYLRDLEDIVMRLLNEYSIAGERSEGKTGVWVGGKKISQIGVAASDWVTYHGLSLNVNVDLSFFSMIYPCGLKETGAVSVKEIIGRDICMQKLKSKFAAHAISALDLETGGSYDKRYTAAAS